MFARDSYRRFCEIYFELLIQGLSNKDMVNKHPKLSQYKMPDLFTPTWQMVLQDMEKYGLTDMKETDLGTYKVAK